MNKLIVMLEGDSDDRYLTEEMMAELGLEAPIQFFSNSQALFEFLAGPEKPSLIMADYNSVPDNGLDVLKKLKKNDRFKDIPVVILSDNDLSNYKKACYAEGASSFIKKPSSFEATRQKIGTFFNYWLDVAEI